MDSSRDYSGTTNRAVPGSHGVSPGPCPRSALAFETLCARGFSPVDAATGAVSAPIVQAATFAHPSLGESTGFDYARGLHPTRLELERTLAQMERGEYALAFSSGMAAVSCWLKKFAAGAEIVVSEDLYGGTWRLFSMYESCGLSFRYVDTSDLDAVRGAVTGRTDALFIETPSNPMMRVTDIASCAEIAHSAGAELVVDNTFLTPFLQNPLELGADVVVHSASKYLGGHNDTVAGALVYNGLGNDDFLRAAQMAEGACLSPFDSWLVLRGIRTLPLRMERACANAGVVARFLRSHPAVERVFWPGFDDAPGFGLNSRQARGAGAMVSFRLRSAAAVPSVLGSLRVILFAESLGGVQSLMTYPWTQTHSAIPEDVRRRVGVDERLLRLSVGVESADDLTADLARALGGA